MNSEVLAPEWVTWLMGTQGIHVIAAFLGFVFGVIVAGVLSRVMSK